jgi:hypothetical protein
MALRAMLFVFVGLHVGWTVMMDGAQDGAYERVYFVSDHFKRKFPIPFDFLSLLRK